MNTENKAAIGQFEAGRDVDVNYHHLSAMSWSASHSAADCSPSLLDSYSSNESGSDDEPYSPEIPFPLTSQRLSESSGSGSKAGKKQSQDSSTPSVSTKSKPKALLPAARPQKNAAELARTPAQKISPVRRDIDASDSDNREKGKQRAHDHSDDLEEVKWMLKKLVKKVEQNERTLSELQKTCSSGGVGSAPKTPKRTVPTAVRQEVRKVYKALEDEECEEFSGWTISPGKSIRSHENQSVLAKLVKEVKSLNPSFDAADIREAGYRFYKTRCEEESAKRRGKDVERRVIKRRYERIVRKRKEREAALMKNTKLTDEQRQKWLKVMRNDFMSSEESEEESIIVHPLPWRSSYVSEMFTRIDAYNEQRKSSQSRRQSKMRKNGSVSSRTCPTRTPDLDWAFADS